MILTPTVAIVRVLILVNVTQDLQEMEQLVQVRRENPLAAFDHVVDFPERVVSFLCKLFIRKSIQPSEKH